MEEKNINYPFKEVVELENEIFDNKKILKRNSTTKSRSFLFWTYMVFFIFFVFIGGIIGIFAYLYSDPNRFMDHFWVFLIFIPLALLANIFPWTTVFLLRYRSFAKVNPPSVEEIIKKIDVKEIYNNVVKRNFNETDLRIDEIKQIKGVNDQYQYLLENKDVEFRDYEDLRRQKVFEEDEMLFTYKGEKYRFNNNYECQKKSYYSFGFAIFAFHIKSFFFNIPVSHEQENSRYNPLRWVAYGLPTLVRNYKYKVTITRLSDNKKVTINNVDYEKIMFNFDGCASLDEAKFIERKVKNNISFIISNMKKF
ncbi:hypothetical protein SCHIN_v1c03300 [Spiroplasma chinense]|uniref:DUF3137 domain-containing protein n=1 Tax=Spiroplasma chinense TaxID=216932 RepID=A0A5B9Y5I5_9MOLU|nr:hypothetical protein [Spiroplasma chinense]QEH61527.1 hypothetical protein SCHIN_v1c03300 [Spiroplasma chinense]